MAPKLPKSRSVSRTSSTSGPFHQDYAEIVDEDADYSSPSRDFELDRECVHLSQILGQGQFGDVYGGFYSHPTGQDDIHVAVKTCKLEADESTAEKILEEACKIFNITVFENCPKKSHSTLQAKRAKFTFYVDKS